MPDMKGAVWVCAGVFKHDPGILLWQGAISRLYGFFESVTNIAAAESKINVRAFCLNTNFQANQFRVYCEFCDNFLCDQYRRFFLLFCQTKCNGR